MSKESFDIEMVLDTDEALENFLKAIQEANERGPLKTRDFSADLARGEAEIAKRCPFDDDD